MLITLGMVELMPGDPAATIAGPEATPAQVQLIRHHIGLDRPFLERFGDQLDSYVHGNLGTSLVTGLKVTRMIGESLPPTLSIAGLALVITALVGLGAGTTAALNRGKRIDHLINGAAALALSIPVFVVGLALILVLAVDRSWFPATGYQSVPQAGYLGWLGSIILPSVALAMNSSAELTRQVRGALVDVFEQDYIRTSRSAGLSRVAVIGKHALRNAAGPIVTVFGLQVGRIIGGAVLVEQVFAIPGFGSMAYHAVQQRDIPVIQAAVLVSGVVVVLVNLLTDVLQPILNPKLRSVRA
jgi:peptide/nickel transport system permease protein